MFCFLNQNTSADLVGWFLQRVAARPRAPPTPNLDAVIFWQQPLRNLSSHTNPGRVRYPLPRLSGALTSCEVAFCCRGAVAAGESFEDDLDRQLEDELSLEELMKHRREPDKVCMVKPKWPFQVIQCAL